MSLLRLILGFPLAALILAFAVFNRHVVSMHWSPVHPPLDVPLYVIGLGLMATGFLFGGVMVWLNMAALRKQRRLQRKQIKTLEKELKITGESDEASEPPADFFPALPKKRSMK